MIILLILFAIILIWSVLASQSKQTQKTSISVQQTELQKQLESQKQYFEFHNNPVLTEHHKNIEEIEAKYSLLYNLKKFDSPEMDELIEQCKRDIFIADEYVSLHKHYGAEIPPSYVTFKRLAIIYEKRGQIKEAIDVCTEAIELGFTDKDTMYGRLARLQRKLIQKTQ